MLGLGDTSTWPNNLNDVIFVWRNYCKRNTKTLRNIMYVIEIKILHTYFNYSEHEHTHL